VATRNLIAQGMDVDSEPPPALPGVWEQSPLREAIVGEQIEIVRLLLESGADPNKEYALLMAVAEGFNKSVHLLLQYGADPSHIDEEGAAPLKEAAGNGDLDSARTLLEAGADIEYFGGTDGATVLGAAAFAGHIEMVRFLLESGADVNGQDVNYNTLLKRLDWRLSWESNQLPERKSKLEAIIQLLENYGGTR